MRGSADGQPAWRGGQLARRGDRLVGKAIEVPGLGALNTGKDAEVNAVSCGSAGNCSVGGFYSGPRSQQGFVAVERNGQWGNAIDVPGLVALNKTKNAEVDDVSCGSAGNCAAAGSYQAQRDVHEHGIVAVERHGRWATAIAVPGLAALNKGRRSTDVLALSCDRAGNCAAGGPYFDRPGHPTWFVAVERHGRWSKAIQVPGLAALNKRSAGLDVSDNTFALSCARAAPALPAGSMSTLPVTARHSSPNPCDDGGHSS